MIILESDYVRKTRKVWFLPEWRNVRIVLKKNNYRKHKCWGFKIKFIWYGRYIYININWTIAISFVCLKLYMQWAQLYFHSNYSVRYVNTSIRRWFDISVWRHFSIGVIDTWHIDMGLCDNSPKSSTRNTNVILIENVSILSHGHVFVFFLVSILTNWKGRIGCLPNEWLLLHLGSVLVSTRYLMRQIGDRPCMHNI